MKNLFIIHNIIIIYKIILETSNKQMNTSTEVQIPQEFLCPITLELMNEPVICDDGYTYERASIIDLKDNLSPMTRQPINKNKLIVNRALKDLINIFIEKNNIKKYSKIPDTKQNDTNNTNNLNNTNNATNLFQQLQRDRMGLLNKFEAEQEEKKRQQQEAIRLEQEKKYKKEYEEYEKKKKALDEIPQLERIIKMFNTKVEDIPAFQIGKKNMYLTWQKAKSKNFSFSLQMICAIKKMNINNLFQIYKKICEDLMWIQKYVYGDENNPFVNYIFDKNNINVLKSNITNKNETREYYTINKEEFNKMYPNWHNNNQYHGFNPSPCNNIININTPWTNWENEKINKIGFLNILDNIMFFNGKTSIRLMNPHGGGYDEYITTNLISNYSSYVTTQTSCPCKADFTNPSCGYNYCRGGQQREIPNKYFDPMVKLARVIIEFIEFVRPKVVIMSQMIDVDDIIEEPFNDPTPYLHERGKIYPPRYPNQRF